MAHSDADCKYASLSDDGVSSSEGDTLENISRNHRAHQRRQRLRWAVVIVFVEAVHLLFFYGVFSQAYPSSREGCSNPGPDIDGLAALAAYNTTVTFTNDLTVVQGTEFADHFWNTFVPYSAVVAVDVKEVEKFNMPESVVSPTNSNEMLYQIDGFHELHCLANLRLLLLDRAPNNDHIRQHTMHCLNYIRQTLMCNLDLTLGSTENLKNYGLKDKRICRDYEAVEAWLARNKWKDFEDWQGAKMEAYYKKVAANNGTEPYAPERETVY